MFMTKRQEEDKLTVRLTLFKESLQPKKRANVKAAAPSEAEAAAPSEREHTISIVPLQFASTAPSKSRLLNKESSVNSTKMLLRRHAHVPKRNQNAHEFFKAVYQAKMHDIQYCLRVVSIRSVNPQDGRTPLMAALHVGSDRHRREVFDFLANHGATFDGVDEACRRDLVGWAALLGRHEQLPRILAECSDEPDFQRRDAAGCTCLHLAVMSASVATVDIVIDAMQKVGVGVDIADADGLTPYLLARKLGHSRVAQLLQRKGRASAQQHDPVSFRSPREWSAIGRRERLQQKQLLLQQGNWGVLPLTEEELSQFSLQRHQPHEQQQPQQQQQQHQQHQQQQQLQRGETFAEMQMLALAPSGSSDCRQLVHSAMQLWSQQHMPSYRRPARRHGPGAADADDDDDETGRGVGKRAGKHAAKLKAKRGKPAK